MSASAPGPKRRHVGKPGERRRGDKGDGSSRDASEEDNEEGTSDVDSLASSHHARLPHGHTSGHGHAGGAGINSVHRRALSQKKVGGEVSDGVDSPVYDGDIESSSTIGGTPVHSTFSAAGQHQAHIRRPSSPTPLSGLVAQGQSLGAPLGSSAGSGSGSVPPPPETANASASARQPTPRASRAHLSSDTSDVPVYTNVHSPPTDVPVAPSEALSPAIKSQLLPLSTTKATSVSQGPPRMMSRPKELSDEDIKAFVQRAIDGEGHIDGVERWWKTRNPPTDRPVRIYADGVYDLFHFGHALQLRQAKLSFPSVQLIVGVCSDQLCAAHKSAPAMTHAERCEAVRHCRWADEVVPDAPWVVDQAFMDKYQIDYLAHDELVYPSKDMEDVYAFAKEKGVFLPTRRTPSISTSDLLERIVRGYRDGFFDSKLEKNGHPELIAADVDWDSSASVEKRERRKKGKGGLTVEPLSSTAQQ